MGAVGYYLSLPFLYGIAVLPFPFLQAVADLHLRIICFGREHCPAKGHDPRKCPICSVVGRKALLV